jgi:hypothetical protein
MSKPIELNKLTIPPASLNAMSADDRYALLLLGLMLNEANWLRKLLTIPTLAMSDDPEGQASFGLTALLATTLGGKIHEGWSEIEKGKLGTIFTRIGLTPELDTLRQTISGKLKSKVLLRIRNNIAFHYPERKFDFSKLAAHLDDDSNVIYAGKEGSGNIFSHLSSLAGIEPLVAIDRNTDYRQALLAVWTEVTEVAAMYCTFVSEAMAIVLTKTVKDFETARLTLPNAPEAGSETLSFFTHAPADLKALEELARKKT